MYSKHTKIIGQAICQLGCTAWFALVPMAQAAELSEEDFVRQLSTVAAGNSATHRELRMPDHNGLCAGVEKASGSTKDFEIVAAPPPGAPKVSLSLQFGNGDYGLSMSDKKILDKLARALGNPDLRKASFVLAGHTNATGDKVANRKLSCGRSIAVRDYLISKRVAAKRLSAYGFGQDQPLGGGDAALAENRRVEIRRAESY